MTTRFLVWTSRFGCAWFQNYVLDVEPAHAADLEPAHAADLKPQHGCRGSRRLPVDRRWTSRRAAPVPRSALPGERGASAPRPPVPRLPAERGIRSVSVFVSPPSLSCPSLSLPTRPSPFHSAPLSHGVSGSGRALLARRVNLPVEMGRSARTADDSTAPRMARSSLTTSR